MTLLDWWETWPYRNGSHSMGFSLILTLFICPSFLIRPSRMIKFSFFQICFDPFLSEDQICKAWSLVASFLILAISNSTLMFSSFWCAWKNSFLVDGSLTSIGIMASIWEEQWWAQIVRPCGLNNLKRDRLTIYSRWNLNHLWKSATKLCFCQD